MSTTLELEKFEKRFNRISSNFYNREVKIEYIFQLNREAGKDKYSPHPVARLFLTAADIEKQLDKDISHFTIKEFEYYFAMTLPATETASTNNVSLISRYVDWSIDNGNYIGINNLKKMNAEWKTKFGKTKLKHLWTDNEIRKILESRVNYQDSVIVALLFNGVQGKKNSELVNLKKSDVNFDENILILTSDEGKRTLQIPSYLEWCMKHVAGAIDERIYQKKNGNAAPHIRSPQHDLIISNYVIRSSFNKNYSEKAKEELIHRRLSAIAKDIDESLFTPTSIIRSGALAMAKESYMVNETLTEEDLERVFEYFNITSDGIKRRWKNEFLNEETLKTLYKL